jgi:hypothetical protein
MDSSRKRRPRTALGIAATVLVTLLVISGLAAVAVFAVFVIAMSDFGSNK